MIICNLIGGLGNQMFQYACGSALSIRTNQSLRIAADQFSDYKLHNGLELKRIFNVDTAIANESDLKGLLGWQHSSRFRHLFCRPAMQWACSKNMCIEPHFHYSQAIQERKGPTYVHGYWQSERYFFEIADHVRSVFSFRQLWDEPDLAVLSRLKQQPSASLHVRRGDYKSAKNQGVYAQCDLHYYRNAIHTLRSKIPDIKIFAFSDDPDWVASQLLPEFSEMEVISHNVGPRSANDMRLMSSADHNIIANSSFSWWGAWLNSNPKKIVIAPKRWFVNDTKDVDLIPDTWIRL